MSNHDTIQRSPAWLLAAPTEGPLSNLATLESPDLEGLARKAQQALISTQLEQADFRLLDSTGIANTPCDQWCETVSVRRPEADDGDENGNLQRLQLAAFLWCDRRRRNAKEMQRWAEDHNCTELVAKIIHWLASGSNDEGELRIPEAVCQHPTADDISKAKEQLLLELAAKDKRKGEEDACSPQYHTIHKLGGQIIGIELGTRWVSEIEIAASRAMAGSNRVEITLHGEDRRRERTPILDISIQPQER